MRESMDSEDNLSNEIPDNKVDHYIDTEMMDEMLRETFEGVFEDSQQESSDGLQNMELETVNDSTIPPTQKAWRYPITVSIGMAQIPEEGLASLQKDDLIPLDQACDMPIMLKTPEGKFFKGKLGKLRGHYAIKLS